MQGTSRPAEQTLEGRDKMRNPEKTGAWRGAELVSVPKKNRRQAMLTYCEGNLLPAKGGVDDGCLELR